jgi:hypothetical protein
MSCVVKIEIVDPVLFLRIENCGDIKDFIFRFPKNRTKFYTNGDDAYGLETVEGSVFITIRENGDTEYSSEDGNTILNFTILKDIAEEFVNYVKAHLGETPVARTFTGGLDNPMIEDAIDGDPIAVGGGKRKGSKHRRRITRRGRRRN